MKLVSILAGLLFMTCSAFAQSAAVYKYDADAINSSIKCELSQVADLLRQYHPDVGRMKVYATISGTETTYKKVGGGFSLFGWGASGSYEQETTTLRGARGPHNIHPDNSVNCDKSFVVDVGVLSCFQDEYRLFLENQTITCGQERKATAAVGANGKFSLWVVNAEPSGALSKKRTWKVDLVAPPDSGGR